MRSGGIGGLWGCKLDPDSRHQAPTHSLRPYVHLTSPTMGRSKTRHRWAGDYDTPSPVRFPRVGINGFSLTTLSSKCPYYEKHSEPGGP